VEICDTLDNDCDGTSDEEPSDGTTYYADADGDGYGDGDGVVACAVPEGYAGASGDCDDADAEINAEAVEVCDAADNDCDGTTDVDATDAGTWYGDADKDGYGDPTEEVSACQQPEGYVADDTDCDDHDSATYPGAPETGTDGIDYDCDGKVNPADTPSGDDDATGGDDDATGGDDDATGAGDDDATGGDDDATGAGDDDASGAGDDDSTGHDHGDDGTGCGCTQTGPVSRSQGALPYLALVGALGLMRRRSRRSL
jgi:hypothetical protein